MHSNLFAAAAIAGVCLLAPAPVEASCCDQKASCCDAKASCCDQEPSCCDHKGHHAVEPGAVDILLAMDPQFNSAPPARQSTEVWLMRPTLVGRAILQGRYVIEHDNDRMARGEPCTHLYAYNDRRTPVAVFHCTHLERERASRNVVVLVTANSNMQKLTEFQFAGEDFAHGYPTGR